MSSRSRWEIGLFEEMSHVFPHAQDSFELQRRNDRKRWVYDAFVVAQSVDLKGTFIEFNGDIWHCNPQTHGHLLTENSDEIVRYDNDVAKLKYAVDSGYRMIYVWSPIDDDENWVQLLKTVIDDETWRGHRHLGMESNQIFTDFYIKRRVNPSRPKTKRRRPIRI